MPRVDRKKKERGRSRDLYESEGTASNTESFDYPNWGEGPGLFDTLLVCAGIDPITMDIYDYLDEKEKTRKLSSRDGRSRESSYSYEGERKSRKSERKRSKSKKHKMEKKRDKSRSKSRAGKSDRESKRKTSKSRSRSTVKRVPAETRDEIPDDLQRSVRRLSLSEVPEGMVRSPLLMKTPHNDIINMAQEDIRDAIEVEPRRKYKVFESDVYDDVIPPGMNKGNESHRNIQYPRFESSSNMKRGTQNSDLYPISPEISRHYHSGLPTSQGLQSRSRIERNHNFTSQELIRPSTSNVQLMTSNMLLDPTLKETRIAPGDAGLTLMKGPRGLIVQKISRNSIVTDLKVGDIIIALDGVNVSTTTRAGRSVL